MTTQTENGLEIAVIGMAGRYPGAADIGQYWRNIEAGTESVRPLTPEELAAAGVDPAQLAQPEYVNSGAFLDDIEHFDAGLFGYAAKEAQLMDPQHRLFLETAWQALEHAGCAPEQFDGQIGVFAGASASSYLVETVVNNPAALRHVSLQDLMYENNHDLLASRVSYKLNLTGPAIVVGTACSTSLVLLHYACQSLLAGDCDVALAGGARVSVPHKSVYAYAEGGILSRDGHCRSFDAKACGTISSNGVGVVVLKRLSDALRDGDTVHAIVKGTAVNNDGAQKVGFTAPSVDGQAEVVKKALAAAGVPAESIGYVEAHGTATHLGDPVEVAALSKAYRHFTGRRGFCALGSVKANIGHADTAAGVAGVIKVVHMLRHAVLPPSVNFDAPNPEIDFADTPFYVSAARRPWQDAVRRAGVSAFGIGGTNAHAILESAAAAAPSGPSRPWQLLCFSGKNKAALQANIAQFRAWLADAGEAALADAAYTLQSGRTALEYRAAVLCRDSADALAKLGQALAPSHSRLANRPVVFMFSGQGTQYPDMMRGLYEAEPAFRRSVDASAAILLPLLGRDIRELLFAPPGASQAAPGELQRTRYTQPALFVVEYALAQLLMGWGVRPKACIGHSIGEYVAACVAGVFTPEQALALVAARAAAMDAMPAGAMLSVALGEAEVAPYLLPGVSLAAVNAPQMVVVAGPGAAIDAVEAALLEADVAVRRLRSAHAFHSAMMEPCLEVFGRAFDGIVPQAPAIPFISNVTGTWITAQQAVSPAYWLSQLRAPVRFADGVAGALADPASVLLEVGPGRTLASLAEQQLPPERRAQVLACVRDIKRHAADEAVLYGVLGQLWSLGVHVDWRGFYGAERRRKVPLPTYAFQRQRYWLEQVAGAKAAPAAGARLPLAQWFHQPVWRQAALPLPAAAAPRQRNWLLFEDQRGLAGALARELEAAGQRVWLVRAGRRFRMLGPQRLQLRPGSGKDVEQLFDWLAAQAALPEKIVNCWGVTPLAKPGAAVDYAQFETLLHIGRAFSQSAAGAGCELYVLSSHLHDVGGSAVDPAKALLDGVCRVMPKEFEQIRCKSIDLPLPPKKRLGGAPRLDLAALLAELHGGAAGSVALRGRSRFVPAVEPVPLPDAGHAPAFRQQGVYLITGGFGGIGATLARHLASRYRARLILTSRGGVPPEADWAAWLAGHDPSNDKSQRIRLLQELGAAGAQVHVIGADIADAGAMKAGLARAERRLGRVNGVIHSAGIADGALIQRRTAADSAAVFAAKVAGTQLLGRLLRRHALDCFVLCSSLAAHIAPVGQVAYCAANAFEDAFALAGAARGGPTRYLSVGWDSWQEVGMAVNSLGAAQLGYISHGITPAEGVAALERALASGLSHCYTSTRGLPLPEAAPAPADAVDGADGGADAAPAGFHPRPDLAAAFVAPRNGVEACIRDIWQDKIGVAPLGVFDDFFELNGHSLMAVQIIAEIKRKLKVALPTGLIYDNSTIAQLAENVAARAPQAVGEPS
ncbi:SDR family NAD(P)-dependent oxidoreductase [Janthinobacterium fluminis]|uniref:SDR family NAD(P)-dependent oxidoreductase n=1 Tax=Janthinobacterium fluminis TaxID=2987524 RepID=A0ABT5JZC2_9BURK|nr:type I polyketide synthase [Janthinobacterium fluminis]MDC8758075.1 SDR family NAD(P)-dependent oxidoreductase [Janthinobacterium fluminis]